MKDTTKRCLCGSVLLAGFLAWLILFVGLLFARDSINNSLYVLEKDKPQSLLDTALFLYDVRTQHLKQEQARADLAARQHAIEMDIDSQWTKEDYVKLEPLPESVAQHMCEMYEEEVKAMWFFSTPSAYVKRWKDFC
jgi:hypothetical protein